MRSKNLEDAFAQAQARRQRARLEQAVACAPFLTHSTFRANRPTAGAVTAEAADKAAGAGGAPPAGE